MTERALAEDNDVVKALSSDRSDGCDAPNEPVAVYAIAIADDIAWSFIPAAGFGQLTGHSAVRCAVTPVAML